MVDMFLFCTPKEDFYEKENMGQPRKIAHRGRV
jgi:hypothetical protein